MAPAEKRADARIPGLVEIPLTVHADSRGWFKENWHREKMSRFGLDHFHPVQNNVSFNAEPGALRGFHAEPWNKLVSVASGRVFAAWVDLREGESFGQTHWRILDPSVTVFVPWGVANAFQTLEKGTVYSYLVDDHWSETGQYASVHVADPSLGIPWPLPVEESVVSEKDQHNPLLQEVPPFQPGRILVLGADGQLGRALRRALAGEPGGAPFDALTRAELDLTNPAQMGAFPWGDYAVVVNAAAYTRVDEAETAKGREGAWAVNAQAPASLAQAARLHGFRLIHISTEYVYGRDEGGGIRESDPLSPQGVYAQSKAAGDLAVLASGRNVVLRTSWLMGEGKNFLETMSRLAQSGASPTVVSDQLGRPTFADDLARAVLYAAGHPEMEGVYHVTGDGPVVSWADVARRVFARSPDCPGRVRDVSSEEYASGAAGAAARPKNSVLSLDRIREAGFRPEDWRDGFDAYFSGQGA